MPVRAPAPALAPAPVAAPVLGPVGRPAALDVDVFVHRDWARRGRRFVLGGGPGGVRFIEGGGSGSQKRENLEYGPLVLDPRRVFSMGIKILKLPGNSWRNSAPHLTPEHNASTGVARHHATNCLERVKGTLCQGVGWRM